MESMNDDINGESFVAEPVPDTYESTAENNATQPEQCVDGDCDCGDVVGGSETD